MKNRILAIAGLVTMLGAGTAFGVYAQGTTPPVTPPVHIGKGEHHPEMRRALRALNNAATALKSAAHDYDGHREKALDLTQQAISQVQQALASDKN